MLHKSGPNPSEINLFLAEVGPDHQPNLRVNIDATQGISSEVSASDSLNAQEIQKAISFLSDNSFLLSSIRGAVQHSTATQGSPRWVGIHGESLLLLLAIIFGQRRHKRISDQLVLWAERFGIRGLQAGYIGENRASADYEDPDLSASLTLALSSSGARQILTVITQIFWAPNGSLLMIEEPEISLHPKAQIDVLEMFSKAIYCENKQIVATTHSHVLLHALGYAVHKCWLDSKDIAVYHIEKRNIGTTAKILPLGKNGYIKGWVPSYTKVERLLLQEWAKTLPRV